MDINSQTNAVSLSIQTDSDLAFKAQSMSNQTDNEQAVNGTQGQQADVKGVTHDVSDVYQTRTHLDKSLSSKDNELNSIHSHDLDLQNNKKAVDEKNKMQQLLETEAKKTKDEKTAKDKEDKLNQVVGAIEHFVSKTDKRLSFEITEGEAHDYIIKVYEAKTGRIVRTIPDLEFLDLNNSVDDEIRNLFSTKI